MRWVLLLTAAAFVLALGLAACAEEEETGTASPTATVARTATPTAAATPAVETGGFDGFRAFAQLIEAALKERDAQFFVQRARVSELTCSGEQERPLPCGGKPAGTILTGIPSRAWVGDAWALLSPAEYAPWLERYFGAARGDLSDSYGSGSLTFYALAHSQEQGEEVFRAFATSMVDINPSGTPIGQTQREARVFNFVFENGRWQFTGERTAVMSTTSPDWLSGQCGQWCDHWERWGGATPPSTPTPESTPSPSPTPTGTAMHRYEPPATFPDPATLPVVDCWTGSLSTLRADGFRCSLANMIHDPCFLSTEAMILACPDDPRDENTTIFARWGGEKDPADVHGPAGEESPWFLVLDAPGNPLCHLVTGATGTLPGGRRADFACSGGIDWCVSPEPTGSGDLVVDCYPGVRAGWTEEEMLAVEIAYTVSEAWY